MQIPYLDLIVPPATEPLTLADTKLALRVDGSLEDGYIVRLIKAARETAEEYLRRSLVTQSWQLQYDQYVPKILVLPKGPVQTVTQVKIISQDWSETIVDPNNYYLNAGKEVLRFKAQPIGLIIQVQYVTGYGDSVDVPGPIKQGMISHVVSMYENRDGVGGLPKTALECYAQYKLFRV